MRRICLAVILSVVAGLPARATGNLDCEIADKAVKATLSTLLSRSIPGLVQPGGTIEVLAKGVPADFRTVELKAEHYVHSWINGPDVKLMVYVEPEGEPFRAMTLIVETRRRKGGDEDVETYAGTYALTVEALPPGQSESKKTVYRGRATCSAG
jgi:hypothetical protein